jgi:hypothetical protein
VVCSTPLPHLPPGERAPVPIVQEAGWAPGPVWTQRLEEKSSTSVGERTPAVQSVVRHYTDSAARLSLNVGYGSILLAKLNLVKMETACPFETLVST